jgi:hypothetical protein
MLEDDGHLAAPAQTVRTHRLKPRINSPLSLKEEFDQ